jgi:hypothetical protein
VNEKPKTTAERLRILELETAQMKSKIEATEAVALETQALVRQINDALLKPQPGHEKPLLDRVAAVTIKVERGEWSIKALAWLAAIIPAGLATWLFTQIGGGR